MGATAISTYVTSSRLRSLQMALRKPTRVRRIRIHAARMKSMNCSSAPKALPGTSDKIFLALLLVYGVLLLLVRGSAFGELMQFILFILGAWILIRLTRVGLRKAIWRLRNRLLVTYVLIAVVPILLILALSGLGAYMLASQIAIYLARSELDRRVTAMQAATEILMRAEPAARAEMIRRTGEIYRERYPDIAFLVEQRGKAMRWPEDSALNPPA